MIGTYDIKVLKYGQVTSLVQFGEINEIRRKILSDGFEVIDIKQRGKFRQKKPTTTETYLLLRLIGDMLKLQPNVSACMSQIASVMEDDEHFKFILYDVIYSIRNLGMHLSDAFLKHYKVFDLVVVNILKSAELAGGYSEAFLESSSFLETITKLKENFYKQLVYPVALFIVGISSVVFTTQYSIPKLLDSPLFDNIPEARESIAVQLMQYMTIFLPIFLLSIACIVIIAIIFYKFDQEQAEKYFIKIPVIREIIFYRGFCIAFYCASKLVKNVKLADTLYLISKTAEYKIIQNEFLNALKALKSGSHWVLGFNHLERVERYILLKSSPQNMSDFLDKIQERFFMKYKSRIESLNPIIYTIVLTLVVFVVLVTAVGIYIPYSKLLRGILEMV